MHHTINAAVTKRHEAAHAQINLRQKGTRSFVITHLWSLVITHLWSLICDPANVYLKTIEIYQQHESSYNTYKRNEHHSQAQKKDMSTLNQLLKKRGKFYLPASLIRISRA